MKKLIITALFSAALICGTASATVLTFDAGVGNGAAMPQDYGDNVTSSSMDAYSYGENGEGFTPNVTVDYIGESIAPTYWGGDFSGTTGVLNNEADADNFLSVKFIASSGKKVVLHNLLWSSYASTQLPVNSITVTDEGSNVLYNSGLFQTGGTNAIIDFGGLTGTVLTVTADLTSANTFSDAFGLDNITFSEVWDPSLIEWVAPVESGLSIVQFQGSYSVAVEELNIYLNNTVLYSSTNSLSFDFEQMVEPGDELLFLGLDASGIVQAAESLSFTTLKENLAVTTLDDFDGEYPSSIWETVPLGTWSGLKQVYESPTNWVMTGGDYMYYGKASYRALPFSVTTNTHMSIQYFSKLGPKYRSDSSGISGIALSGDSLTNDGDQYFEFRMRGSAVESDLAQLVLLDTERSPIQSIQSPNINTWVEFRLDFDWGYVDADGKHGLCTVFMKQEGATRWQLLSDLSQIELKVDDPSEIKKIVGIGHCSWNAVSGYYGFQPFLDDIRYCSGENANLGAGTNLLLDAAFNEVQTPWRRDGQGRTIVPSMHTNNEPFHDGVYLTCRSSYTAEVYQVINLLDQGFAAEDIDAGIYRAAFGGWQLGWNGSSGQIEIEYLDINQQPISTNSLPVITNTYPNWIEQMATNQIPDQTRSIRYSTYLSSSARLDDAHLSVLGIPQEDVALTVSSIHGSPVPMVGTESNSWGTVVNCSVAHVNAGTTQYECLGWAGTGSVTSSGTANSVEVTLTENSSITWNWATNYLLDITIVGNGSVDADDAFYVAGSEQILTATQDAGWLFMGWSGDASGTNAAVVTMDAPKAVTATFSDDADNDGLLNSNETAIGSNPWKSDTDDDGFGDKLEVDNGGSPTVSDVWRTDYIRSNGGDFGLYPSNAVLDVAVGQMVLDVIGSEATLSLQLEESDDLVIWTNAGPPEVWSWTVDGEKKFFRVRSSK